MTPDAEDGGGGREEGGRGRGMKGGGRKEIRGGEEERGREWEGEQGEGLLHGAPSFTHIEEGLVSFPGSWEPAWE